MLHCHVYAWFCLLKNLKKNSNQAISLFLCMVLLVKNLPTMSKREAIGLIVLSMRGLLQASSGQPLRHSSFPIHSYPVLALSWSWSHTLERTIVPRAVIFSLSVIRSLIMWDREVGWWSICPELILETFMDTSSGMSNILTWTQYSNSDFLCKLDAIAVSGWVSQSVSDSFRFRR